MAGIPISVLWIQYKVVTLSFLRDADPEDVEFESAGDGVVEVSSASVSKSGTLFFNLKRNNSLKYFFFTIMLLLLQIPN